MAYKIDLSNTPRTTGIKQIMTDGVEEGQPTVSHFQQSQDQQEKVFTRWCNIHLKKRDQKIEDGTLTKGALDDGFILWHLLSQLSGKTLRKLDPPKMRTHKLGNITCTLQFLVEENIKTVGIGCEDILDRNAKLIMGLTWTIILRYQISGDGSMSDAKKAIIAWLNSVGIPCTILKDVFSDGIQLSNLVNILSPGSIDNKNLDGTKEENTDYAMGVAEKYLDIPRICDCEDLVGDFRDEKIVMTYVSFYKEKSSLLHDVGAATLIIDDEIIAKATDSKDSNIILLSPRGAKGDEGDAITKSRLNSKSTPKINIVKKANQDGVLSPREGGFSPRDTPVSPRGGTPLSPRSIVSPRNKPAQKTDEEILSELASNYMKFRVNKTTNLKLRAINISNASDFKLLVTNTSNDSTYNDYDVEFVNDAKDKSIWVVKFTPKKEGTVNMDLQITKQGQDITTQAGGFPIKAKILPAENIEKLSLLGDAQGVTDKPFVASLVTDNSLGLDIKVTDPNGKEIKSLFSGEKLQFTPTEAGPTTVSVTRNGKHIDGSPCVINVKQSQSCNLDNSSLPDCCIPQVETDFSLYTKGIAKEDLKIVATQNGKPIKTRFGDSSDLGKLKGSHTGESELVIAFTPEDLSGNDKENISISVSVNNSDCPPVKFDIPVQKASWTTDIDKPCRSGAKTSFNITCNNFKPEDAEVVIFDSNNNQLDSKYVSTENKGSDNIEVSITPPKPGTYRIQCNSKKNGKNIGGDTQTIKVVPSYAALTDSTTINYEDHYVNEHVSLKFKSNVTDNLQVKVLVDGIEVPCTLNDDDAEKGNYEVSFTSQHPGKVKLVYYDEDENPIQNENEDEILTIKQKPFASVKEVVTFNPKINSTVNCIVSTNTPVDGLTCEVILSDGTKAPAQIKPTGTEGECELIFESNEATGPVKINFFQGDVNVGSDDQSINILPPTFVKISKCPKTVRNKGDINLVFNSNVDKLRIEVTHPDGSKSQIKNISTKSQKEKKEITIPAKGVGKTSIQFYDDDDGTKINEAHKEITVLEEAKLVVVDPPKTVEVNKKAKIKIETNLEPKEIQAIFDQKGKSVSTSVVPAEEKTAERHRRKSTSKRSLNTVEHDSKSGGVSPRAHSTKSTLTTSDGGVSPRGVSPRGVSPRSGKENDLHEYYITFTPRHEGVVACKLQCSDKPLTNDFKINVIAEEIYAIIKDLADDLVIPTNQKMSFTINTNCKDLNCEIIDVQNVSQKIKPTITPIEGKTNLFTAEFVPKHEGNFFVYFLQGNGTPIKGAPRSFNVRTKAQPFAELGKVKKNVVPGNKASFVINTRNINDISQLKITITGEKGEKVVPELSWIYNDESIKPSAPSKTGADKKTSTKPVKKPVIVPTGTENSRKCLVEYVPTKEGEYFIDAALVYTIDGKITGFPISVTSAYQTDSKLLGFSEDKSEGVELLETCLVFLNCSQVEKLEATVKFFNQEKTKVNLLEVTKDSREYMFKFNAKTPGPGVIEVLYRNKHIDGSPLHFEVNPEPWCEVDFDNERKSFVNEQFFFTITTSRNVPMKAIKYVATEKGGKSVTFVPDAIGSKTRVQSKTEPPYPITVHNYFVYWKFEGDRESEVKTEVTIYGKHIPGSPFSNRVEEEHAIFKNPLKWAKLVEVAKDGMNIDPELQLQLQWQTTTSVAIPLQFNVVCFDYIGEVVESLGNGRNLTGTNSMEIISSTDKNEESLYINPSLLSGNVACVAIFVVCKDLKTDFTSISKFVFSVSQTKGKLKLPGYVGPRATEKMNTFLVGFVEKIGADWKFHPVGEFATSRFQRFYTDLLPLYHKQITKYIAVPLVSTSIEANFGQRLPVYPDIEKLFFNIVPEFSKPQRQTISYSAVIFYFGGKEEHPTVCDARRNKENGILVPSDDEKLLNINLSEVSAIAQSILVIATAEDDFQDIKDITTTVSASNANQKKPYDIAKFKTEKWRLNTPGTTIVLAKVFRRSANSVWEIVPIGAGFKESTDDLLSNFSEISPKSDALKKEKTSAAMKKGHSQPSKSKGLDSYLEHFWSPAPTDLHIYVLTGNELSMNPKGKVNPFLQFDMTPGVQKVEYKMPAQVKTKVKTLTTNNAVWNELFVFENVSGYIEKELPITVSCFCAADGAQNLVFIGQFKLNLKKILSDCLHKGNKGIETTYKLTKNSEQANSRSVSGEVVLRFVVG